MRFFRQTFGEAFEGEFCRRLCRRVLREIFLPESFARKFCGREFVKALTGLSRDN